MKMTTMEAQSTFAIKSIPAISLDELKKRYKRVVLQAHPDKGGDKESMQRINAAYEVLKAVVSKQARQSIDCDAFGSAASEDEWYFKKNEGHPLHNAQLAATKSMDSLIAETFDIWDGEAAPDIRFNLNRYSTSKVNGTFFQENGKCMRINYWTGERDVLIINDVTNGFLSRKNCLAIRLEVKTYSNDYAECSKCLSNVIREWLSNNGLAENGFRWSDFMTHFIGAVEVAQFTEFRRSFCEGALISLEQDSEDYFAKGTVEVGGHIVGFRIVETNAQKQINPFYLERVKPLKKIPTRWKIMDLVKLLVNGQFHSIKRNYSYTDDYALDAANRFSRGYIENPLAVAMEWFGETKRSCTRLYESGETLSFGFHSNDSSSLIVDLDNSYPMIDIENEVADMLKANQRVRLDS